MSKATELRELASLTTISSGQIQFDTDIKISGDLITTGNTINITADTLNISDPNITLASGAANSSVADGAGITIDGANATLTWNHADSRLKFSHALEVEDGLYLNRTSSSYGPSLEFLENGVRTWRIKPDADGGNNGSLIVSPSDGSTQIEIEQSGYTTFKNSIDVEGSILANTGLTISAGKLIVRDGGYPYLELGISSTNYFRAVHDNPNDSLVFQKYGLSGNIMTLHGGSGVGVTIGTETHSKNLNVHGEVTANQYNNDEVRHSIAPTLNLDFANSKQLDSRISFYRGSVATYYDSKGVLRYATDNEPRFDHDPYTGESKGLLIEEERTNDLQGGELLYATGATNYGGYWVHNYAKAPNGKYEASALYGDGSSQSARAYWSTTGANTYTFSVYAKDNGSGRFSLWAYSGGWVYAASFTWQADGTLTTDRTPPTYDDTVIEMVGGGWARISATWTTPGNGSFQVSPGLYANYVENDSTLFWGGQLEIGKSFSTSFIPGSIRFNSRASIATYWDENGILRTASSNEARYGYSKPYQTETFEKNSSNSVVLTDRYTPPKSPVKAGMILEPQAATNLATNSYNLASYQSAYAPGNSTWELTDEVQAPDGSYTASKFTFATDVGNTNSGYTSTIYEAYQDATWYTYSIWLKGPAGTCVSTALLADTGSNLEPTIYLTGEWQNVIIHKYYLSSEGGTYLRTHSVIQRNAPGVSTTTTDGRSATRAGYCYVWGEQIVQGIHDSTYIPTFNGTATRAADVYSTFSTTRKQDNAYIEGQAFENFYNDEGGSVYVNYQLGKKLAQMRVASLSDGTSSNYIDFIAGYGASGSTTQGCYMFGPVSGSSSIDTSASGIFNTANANIKFAGRIKENDYFGVTNADSEVGTDTDAGVPVVDRLNFGDYNRTDSQSLCGHLRKLSYYPEPLTDAELIALTEND